MSSDDFEDEHEIDNINTNININGGEISGYYGIIKGGTTLEGTVTSRPDSYVINSSTDQATGYNQLVLGR